MTENQRESASEREPTDPEIVRAMMAFVVAAESAGVGSGVRSVRPVQRSDEAAGFVRMSLYPSALDLVTRLLLAHVDARTKQETGDLLRVLAGEEAS
jgi:hypothetical protein